MAQDEHEKRAEGASSTEPPTIDESRAARYRREHEDFLANSLRPLPPLSPPPPAARGGWLAKTLWFLVIIYGVFLGATWLARFIARFP